MTLTDDTAPGADARTVVNALMERPWRIVHVAGHGMPPDTVARAGEPFFTTKPYGSGLGLGLFLARAFADQMGGTLTVQSNVGHGTSVVLELPAR
jgi:two-component system sensor histidine kinase RegB